MNKNILFSVLVFILSCGGKERLRAPDLAQVPITGSWKLISGTLIERGDTNTTFYTEDQSFIKIINESHFAFMGHDLNHGEDSTAYFVSGGGRYSLQDTLYTEHLEYCSDRQWEGKDFSFTVHIKDDTLIQRGVEKVPEAGIDRLNIEKYVSIRN